MPSPVAHALVGALIAHQILPAGIVSRNSKLLVAGMFGVIPDLDFVPQLLFGAERGMHRGPMHSTIVAIAAGAALALGRQRLAEATVCTAAMVSHGILDALTSIHGSGVMLLWPFSSSRWKLAMFEWPGIDVSASWSKVFSRFVIMGAVEAAAVLAIAALFWLIRSVICAAVSRRAAKEE